MGFYFFSTFYGGTKKKYSTIQRTVNARNGLDYQRGTYPIMTNGDNMLHRIVKLVTAYVGSVCERKHILLDNQNYTVEITVSTRNLNGDLISVGNSINVIKGLPHTYSETIRNAAGQTLDFVAGASGNKRRAEQDKLVESFAEAKAELAAKNVENEPVVAEPPTEESKIVKAKKTRVKKSEKVEANDPQTA